MAYQDRPRSRAAGRTTALTAALLISGLLVSASARAAPAPSCVPADGARFICGATNVEDFAPVPRTKWVIGSDLAAKSQPQGFLHLFDTSNHTVTSVQPSAIAIRPDKKAYPDCPGPMIRRPSARMAWT